VGDRGSETQQRILEASLAVFGRLGYHQAQIEAIAEEAGCSRPAFYQYFSSKEDVFWTLARGLVAELRDTAAKLADFDASPRGVSDVRAWLEEMIALEARSRPIINAYPAAVRGQQLFARDSLGVSTRIGSRIQTGSRAGAGAADPLQALLLPITLRTINYWRLGLGGVSAERFADGYAQTIHRLRHGALDSVNIGPVVRPPTKRVPPWPEFPESDDDDDAGSTRSRKTRGRLLAAGVAVLPERGYFETRIDDIVERAELSHGTFYRYFDSKEDLFRVLALAAAEDMVRLLGEFPSDVSGADLDSWFSVWLESYWANGGIIGEWQEINYEDPSLAEFSLGIALSAFDRLQRIVSTRGFGDSTVDALAMLALVERSPYISRVFATLAPRQVAPAMATFARRAVFGLPGA